MIKRFFTILACIPILIILAFVVFEIVGAGVNHYETKKQTNTLKENIISVVQDAEILNTYSETGNTSGTGNHVDMLSAVLIKTKAGSSGLQNKLSDYYPSDDDCSFWADTADSVISKYGKSSLPSFYSELDVPKDMQDMYIVYLCRPAPFADNIEGH